MLGVMRLILDRDEGSARGDEDFFSVARTIPLVAVVYVSMRQSNKLQILVYLPLIPRAVTPWLTALRAYSVSGCQ